MVGRRYLGFRVLALGGKGEQQRVGRGPGGRDLGIRVLTLVG